MSTKTKDLREFIERERGNMRARLGLIVEDRQKLMVSDPEDFIEHGADEPSIDIRLCIDPCQLTDRTGLVTQGFVWLFRTGLSDFDSAHSRYCGAGSIGLETDVDGLLIWLIDELLEAAE